MRKGFDGLATLIQQALTEDPFSGQIFVFRGRRGKRPVKAHGAMTAER
jgi:transposase